jgi:hypothetical protein
MVFSIAGFPLASMADDYRSCLSKPQFRHFKTMLAGLMLNGKSEKNVMDIASNALDGKSQSSLNRFLQGRKWSMEKVNVRRLERYARGRAGGVLILDDTLIQKTGVKMEGTGWLFDHSQQRNIWCHCYVSTLYSHGEERVPMQLTPYLKEESCPSLGRRFRTKNELAVELVDKALEYIRPDAVVFDSWYGSQELLNHIDSRGQVFITEAKSNRLIENEEGKVQARDYQACHRQEFRRVDRPETEYRWYLERVSVIKGGLKVKFVFLKQRWEDEALVLMTNALNMDVQAVVKYYKRRWDIEVFYRDCKQCLGMGEYQVRRIDVGVIHLLLVFLAYTILKGIARGRMFQHIFKGVDSIGAMCESLKRFVVLDLAASFKKRS